MDRTFFYRTSGPNTGPKLALMASAAVAGLALAGCTTASAPRADVSFNKAQVAMEKGQTSEAIEYAEAAVLADPRNADFRALLGAAYLDAGRYNSAAQSFGDALELGDTSSKTVLSYALAETAIGGSKKALAELLEWERSLDAADAGLALALAGNPERGVFVLTNALRAGQNTAKVRQNLAYTYALAGNWRAARVMAAEDVPANQLDARLSQWAANARPEDAMLRVSSLLGVAPAGDNGVPARLALSNFPSTQQMLAEADTGMSATTEPAQIAAAPGQSAKAEATNSKPETAPAATPVSQPAMVKVAEKKAEKPTPAASNMFGATAEPKASSAPAPKPAVKSKASARASMKTVQPAGPRFVSRPVTQTLPKRAEPKPAPASTAQAAKAKKAVNLKGSTHMVQLGSYPSDADAKAGWSVLKRRYPELADHDVVITKAQVKGKTFYRVAAADFGRRGAATMCSRVKSKGGGCFAYTVKNPPAGALGKGTRIAAAR